MNRVPGLLLTGGAGKRMGTDKALVQFEGTTLSARAAEMLGRACDPVVELGPGHTGLRFIEDREPFAGPLAAMAGVPGSLPEEVLKQGAVVLAADMPWVTPALLTYLASASAAATVVPRSGGHPQPLCARYSRQALEQAQCLVQTGARSMRDLLEAIEVQWLEGPQLDALAGEDGFKDIDTPEDLEGLT